MERIEKSQFQWVGPDTQSGEAIVRKSVTYWRDAMRRLAKNRVALFCGVFIVLMILATVILPMLSPFQMQEQHYGHTNAPMFTLCDHGETAGDYHLFGTDSLGRDLYTRIWEGGRVSLFIAFVAVFINFIIGIVYGGIAGYLGGIVDNILMRIIEVISGIPYLMIVILLKMVVGQSDTTGIISLIVAYAAVGWTGMARLVRGQIVSLKEQEFVIAAKALGASAPRLIARHLLPNSMSVIIVNITLAIPNAIFTEAFLSFIGMGVSVPNCSWGSLANDGVTNMRQYPSQLILPALCISLVMLSFNLLGDGLRDALDPKLRR